MFIAVKLLLDVQRTLYIDKTHKIELEDGGIAINLVYVNCFLFLFVRVIILIRVRRIQIFERTKYKNVRAQSISRCSML